MSFLCSFRSMMRKRTGDKSLTSDAKKDLFNNLLTLRKK